MKKTKKKKAVAIEREISKIPDDRDSYTIYFNYVVGNAPIMMEALKWKKQMHIRT